MADAPVGDVVVGDLDDELGAQRDPLQVAAGGPARRVAAAALTGLVRRELGDELALALGGEAAGMADLAQAPGLLVEAEDDRADRALLLARPPAHHDGIDRAHALDLDHALARAGQVRARKLLGDHALLVAKPVLRLGGAVDDGRQLDPPDRLQRGLALLIGAAHQDLVADREHVEGDESRRRLRRQALDPRRGGMDAIAQRAERRGHELAVDDVAPRREGHLGEVARQRLGVARLQVDLVAVDERDRAKAVPLGLVCPALVVRQLRARARKLGRDGRLQRERHREQR